MGQDSLCEHTGAERRAAGVSPSLHQITQWQSFKGQTHCTPAAQPMNSYDHLSFCLKFRPGRMQICLTLGAIPPREPLPAMVPAPTEENKRLLSPNSSNLRAVVVSVPRNINTLKLKRTS